jgi:hypothetical protein
LKKTDNRRRFLKEKVCSACKASLPRSLEHFYARRKGESGLDSTCKECAKAKNRARYHKEKFQKYRPKKNEALLTTMKERQENGPKCLGLDVLTKAVLAHKEGEDLSHFWHSWNFELFCALAEMHPEFIRRGVLGRDTQEEPCKQPAAQ